MEISEFIPLIISIIILLFLSAFFSGSETALFSLSRSALSFMERGGKRERRVAAILGKPRMLLVTILFGNLLVNIANTSVVTALAISLFGESGVAYAMILMTFLILIFGEITPKSIALHHSTGMAPLVVSPLRFFMILFTPVRLLLGFIADLTVDLGRRMFGEHRESYASSELETAVEMGHIDGLFDEFEKEILINLFRFTETEVHEIQTPRVEVFTLDPATSLQDAIIQVRGRGFTRIPLLDQENHRIEGILHARDMLAHPRDERITVADIMRSVKYVPETKKIRDLLGELIAASEHVAISVDEHGSFEGLITLEDILEEIVGEIRDRLEPKVDEFTLLDKDQIVVEGTMRLEDLGRKFGVELDSDEVETVAGYLIEAIGRIPRDGEVVELDRLRWLILSSEPTRINKIKIERSMGEEEEDERC